jgi:hypothetical protein
MGRRDYGGVESSKSKVESGGENCPGFGNTGGLSVRHTTYRGRRAALPATELFVFSGGWLLGCSRSGCKWKSQSDNSDGEPADTTNEVEEE